ncbi:PepSY-associated TM helix domain-containing protein [Castellaniella defragrans]|uniref:PepSY-associated TM helix domain-containing protein n=1 Tax=Castellaniella defragrans TaxID=75697 RepID=UPI002AFE81B2|nr:PepSY-associated TM helix domain-containing protein [Castellaniella defragrans]
MAWRRRLWLRIHLWGALTLGLVFALLGLSGSMLVLRAPLLQWEVGSAAIRLKTAPGADTPYASQEAWKAAARDAYPQFERIMGAARPRAGFLTSDNAIVFGAVHGRRAMGVAMIDPYTAQPRAFFIYDDLLLARIVALHRSLFLPRPVAGPVLAVCGLVLLVSMATGAWLWWPRGPAAGRWRRGLTMRRQSRGLRRCRELHDITAGYLFFPLLVLALTGTWLARPEWFAWLDPDGSLKPMASALHARLMLGLAGEAIAFVAGLALPVLYVSGLLMWWKKKRRGP